MSFIDVIRLGGYGYVPSPRRSGVAHLPVFRRPVRDRLIGCSHCAGVAPLRAPPPACDLTPLRGLFGETTMAQTQGLRPFGLHHLPVVYRLSEALIPAQVRRPFRARLIGRLLCRGCALSGFTACLWSVASPRLAGIDDCPLVEVAFVLSSKRRLPSRRAG